MMTIHKFPLHDITVAMPKDAKILCAQDQGGQITVWALVDDLNDIVYREFRVVGTGHDAGHIVGHDYVGTVQQGRFVWHVFTRELP